MAYNDAVVTLGVLITWCWLLSLLPGGVDGKPVEKNTKYGLLIQIPDEFVKAVPLDESGQLQVSDWGPASRAFPSLFVSDADTIFGPAFTSQTVKKTQTVKKKMRAQTVYQNSDMDHPKVSSCEAYCALKDRIPA